MAANQHPSLDHDEMHLLSRQQPPAVPPVAILQPPYRPLQSTASTSTTAAAAATASFYPPLSVTAMGGGPVILQQRSELRRSFSATPPTHHHHHHQRTPSSSLLRKTSNEHHRTLTKYALIQNNSMVYLDGPQIYTCGNCRTHLTSHDDIISKSFHGRHGRAYLFDQCVNITHGPAEDRILITGLHSVSDIYCKRCKTLIGWTYNKAYESAQKYKEKKYIIEKIYLHLEVSDGSVYDGVNSPAGEKCDRFCARSMSWGSNCSRTRGVSAGSYGEITTTPTLSSSSWLDSPGYLSRSRSRSGSGSPYTIRTPPTATSTRGSSPIVPMMSPSLPNNVIYEYR